MQGTPNNGDGRVLDLNALLAERRLDPVEVKLGDNTYMVNTDLTAAETDIAVNLLRNGHDAAAFTLMIGTAEDRKKVVATVKRQETAGHKTKDAMYSSAQAKKLDSYIEQLPRLHQALVSAALMRTTKAMAEWAKPDDVLLKAYNYELEPAGESTAS